MRSISVNRPPLNNWDIWNGPARLQAESSKGMRLIVVESS